MSSSDPSSPMTPISAMPSVSRRAVSIDSVRRWRMSSRRTSRSTTTSMVCCSYRARFERGALGQLHHLAVDPGPGEALLGQVVEERLVLPLAPPHHRGEHLEARPLGQVEDAVDDLLRRLAGHGPPAVGAVGPAHPGVEQPQVVVDLGDRAHRRAGVAAGGLLVDGDGRRQSLDEVDVGLVHLPQELPGVRRQRLDVPALAFGVDGVEGERRLARPRQAGEDDEPVTRQLERDVAQVVLPRPADHQPVGHRSEATGGARGRFPGR